MTERPGIYGIRHAATGRWYVGSASNISKRWSRHRADLAERKHRNDHLQAAFDLYGSDAFDWIVLELTSALDEREQFWMDRLDAYENGFNLCPTARSSRGRRQSAEERQRRAMTGCAWLNTPEMLDRRREMLRDRNQRSAKLSAATVEQIRARLTGEYGELTQLAREHGVTPGTLHGRLYGRAERG